MILHGIEAPNILYTNTLAEDYSVFTRKGFAHWMS